MKTVEYETTPTGVADATVRMIRELSPAAREDATRLLVRRLAHPELGGNPQAAPPSPPPSTGDCFANRNSSACLRCGRSWGRHDRLTGELDDCEGYIPEK